MKNESNLKTNVGRLAKFLNWLSCHPDRRDIISHQRIRTGTILKVHPELRSHSKIPYLVKVIESEDDYFVTELIDKTGQSEGCPCTRKFIYWSSEWVSYHCQRFIIVLY